MLWRAVLPSVCRAILWVVWMTAGIVVLAVSVEKADQGLDVVFAAVRFQVVAALVWLSPLILACGVCLSGLRRRSCGAEQALASSGIGWPQLTPIILMVGVSYGIAGLGVSEWVLPMVADSGLPGWIWAGAGPVRTADGLRVSLEAAGTLQYVDSIAVGEAFPRMASTSVLMASETVAASTELIARWARVLACVGWAWFGLIAGRFRYPLIVVVAASGVMLVIEAILWSMAAQAQIAPWVGGGIPAVLWLVPVIFCFRQSST